MRKKLSIALLAFSLAMICANFIVRRVGSYFPPSEQEIEEMEEERGFSPFALVKKEDKNTKEEKPIDTTLLVLRSDAEDDIRELKQEKEIIKPILQIELTKEEEQIVETYTSNPKVIAFIKEVSQVISKEELEQQNYLQIVYKPEVRNIFIKYSKDEDFRKMATEIMKDKRMLQLAKKIINNREVKK